MWRTRLKHAVFYVICAVGSFYGGYYGSKSLWANAHTTPATNLPHEICRQPILGIDTPNQTPPVTTPVPPGEWSVFMEGDIPYLESQAYTYDDIGSRDDDDAFRILIIPVGYDSDTDIDSHFAYIAYQAEALWADLGINVRYAYLKRSLPVPIYQYESYVTADAPFTNFDTTDRLIKDVLERDGIYSPDVISIYINSDINLSSTADLGGYYQTIIGEDDNYLYALMHETAHNLGLSDGYEKLYDFSEIAGGTNSELFTDDSKLSEERRQLLEDTETEIARRGYVCNGKAVLSPYGSAESMMGSAYDNVIIFEDDHINPKVLTGYQIALINSYIETKLSEKP